MGTPPPTGPRSRPAPACSAANQYRCALMARTFYDLLMISPYADREIITVVYRHLAKRYHPDRDPSPQAQARMMELNEAYAVLSDRQQARPVRRDRGHRGAGRPRDQAATSSSGAVSGRPIWRSRPPSPDIPRAPAACSRSAATAAGRLNQVERHDRDYVEWLSRTTMGRNYRLELEQLLRRRG